MYVCVYVYTYVYVYNKCISNQALLHHRWILYQLSYQGSSYNKIIIYKYFIYMYIHIYIYVSESYCCTSETNTAW